MFDNENQDEDLKAFEASLGSLHPRADGLDRRWRFLLAQEAAFNQNLGDSRLCFSITSLDDEPVSPEGGAESNVMLKYNLRGCDDAMGHQFVCSRCGDAISSGRREKHRWAWPTAFSAMTAAAAILLVALVVRSGLQTAVTPGEQGMAVPSTSAAQDQPSAVSWLADGNGLPRRPVSGSAETSYLNLRDQVLRYGVDSWRLPVSAVATAKIAEPPLSYREQLDRLLKQEAIHGS